MARTPTRPRTPIPTSTRTTPASPASPTPEQIARLIPSEAVMASVDHLFNAPPESDIGSSPAQVVGNPDEMMSREGANKMIEKGLGGRGVIPIKSNRPDFAYRMFLKALGTDDPDHTHIKSALSTVDTSAANRALAMLFNPRHRRTSIETILKRAGIGIPQMRDIWRQYRLDEGMGALLNAYPAAMKDVARDARSTREACRFCSGSGRVADETAPPVTSARKVRNGSPPQPVLIQCHSCYGRGWVRKSGDKDARSLMGQILGVSGKAVPLISSTTNILNLESVIGDIEHMQRKTLSQQGTQQGSQQGIYDITPETEPETEPDSSPDTGGESD